MKSLCMFLIDNIFVEFAGHILSWPPIWEQTVPLSLPISPPIIPMGKPLKGKRIRKTKAFNLTFRYICIDNFVSIDNPILAILNLR